MSDLGLRQVLLIGSGGFIGSVLRYAATEWVLRIAPGASMPYGTLAVNVSGCLAIGLLGGLAEYRALIGPEARLFLIVGLLGGFTTFSAFGYENLALLRDQQLGGALLHAILHVGLGLTAAWLGFLLGRSL